MIGMKRRSQCFNARIFVSNSILILMGRVESMPLVNHFFDPSFFFILPPPFFSAAGKISPLAKASSCAFFLATWSRRKEFEV